MTSSQWTDEYEALTAGCGFVPLEQWSVVTLAGADRHNFLHNMCTNDINKLQPGEGCEAFCTDVKGKVHAHVFVFVLEEKITLLTVPDQATALVAALDRYLIREDVQLVDETENTSAIFVAGSGAAELLKQLAPAGVETLGGPWRTVSFETGNGPCLISNFPLPGRNAFLLLIDSRATQVFAEQLNISGATACGLEAWNTLRIESGLPLFGIDFNNEHLPQEIARDGQAISFTKGCYLGQETVARLDALGHVNKQLATVKFPTDSNPESGIILTHQEKQVGAVTSVTTSPTVCAPIGIAMLRREANTVGTVLESPAGPVEVIATPVMG